MSSVGESFLSPLDHVDSALGMRLKWETDEPNPYCVIPYYFDPFDEECISKIQNIVKAFGQNTCTLMIGPRQSRIVLNYNVLKERIGLLSKTTFTNTALATTRISTPASSIIRLSPITTILTSASSSQSDLIDVKELQALAVALATKTISTPASSINNGLSPITTILTSASSSQSDLKDVKELKASAAGDSSEVKKAVEQTDSSEILHFIFDMLAGRINSTKNNFSDLTLLGPDDFSKDEAIKIFTDIYKEVGSEYSLDSFISKFQEIYSYDNLTNRDNYNFHFIKLGDKYIGSVFLKKPNFTIVLNYNALEQRIALVSKATLNKPAPEITTTTSTSQSDVKEVKERKASAAGDSAEVKKANERQEAALSYPFAFAPLSKRLIIPTQHNLKGLTLVGPSDLSKEEAISIFKNIYEQVGGEYSLENYIDDITEVYSNKILPTSHFQVAKLDGKYIGFIILGRIVIDVVPYTFILPPYDNDDALERFFCWYALYYAKTNGLMMLKAAKLDSKDQIASESARTWRVLKTFAIFSLHEKVEFSNKYRGASTGNWLRDIIVDPRYKVLFTLSFKDSFLFCSDITKDMKSRKVLIHF